MTARKALFISSFLLMAATSACGDTPEAEVVVSDITVAETDPRLNEATPLWERHHDAPLRILCIGNSFTHNATTYLPWLIERLNADSICIATLAQAGCSLAMHWTNHTDDTESYYLHYSDHGVWRLSDVKTLDRALTFFDWDMITLQQVSGLAGVYSSYQPFLGNLTKLLRITNPEASFAWHYTWAYTPSTGHPDFKNYDRDSEKMYRAIMTACDRASEGFDLRIPSATLIKRMREEFPEVKDGFSEDGYHISDRFALYALSSLWYDVLIAPRCGSQRSRLTDAPSDVDTEGFEKADGIIARILDTEYGME